MKCHFILVFKPVFKPICCISRTFILINLVCCQICTEQMHFLNGQCHLLLMITVYSKPDHAMSVIKTGLGKMNKYRKSFFQNSLSLHSLFYFFCLYFEYCSCLIEWSVLLLLTKQFVNFP